MEQEGKKTEIDGNSDTGDLSSLQTDSERVKMLEASDLMSLWESLQGPSGRQVRVAKLDSLKGKK